MFARPEYEWVERRPALSWLSNLWYTLVEWLDRLATEHPVGFNIGLALVIVAVALLIFHIGYVVWRIVRPSAGTGAAAGAGPAAVADAASHVARAAELARAGRYAEALGHRFLAVVLELEERKALRFHVSKTPAEYVGEARLDDAARVSFAALVATLYRHLFGAVPCDADDYRAFGAAAERLASGHVLPA